MANTTNLNLVKPAGTDKALVSVLNSNSDKIDAWAGTTNQALSNMASTHVLRSIQKSSTASTTLKFTYTGNRYNALLFVTDNVFSNSGIHAIAFKAGSTPSVTRLNGSGGLPTIDSDGSINIAVNAWSSVELLTADTYFS